MTEQNNVNASQILPFPKREDHVNPATECCGYLCGVLLRDLEQLQIVSHRGRLNPVPIKVLKMEFRGYPSHVILPIRQMADISAARIEKERGNKHAAEKYATQITSRIGINGFPLRFNREQSTNFDVGYADCSSFWDARKATWKSNKPDGTDDTDDTDDTEPLPVQGEKT